MERDIYDDAGSWLRFWSTGQTLSGTIEMVDIYFKRY